MSCLTRLHALQNGLKTSVSNGPTESEIAWTRMSCRAKAVAGVTQVLLALAAAETLRGGFVVHKNAKHRHHRALVGKGTCQLHPTATHVKNENIK